MRKRKKNKISNRTISMIFIVIVIITLVINLTSCKAKKSCPAYGYTEINL